MTDAEVKNPITEVPATDTSVDGAASAEPKRRRTKKKRQVLRAQAHILATYNNTIVTLTDQAGNALVTASAGRAGFKGPKKSTPYAAGVVVRAVAEKVRD
jgi:small subunit ribosomal protein S11